MLNNRLEIESWSLPHASERARNAVGPASDLFRYCQTVIPSDCDSAPLHGSCMVGWCPLRLTAVARIGKEYVIINPKKRELVPPV